MKRRTVFVSTAGVAALAGCVFADDGGPDHEYERGELAVVVDGDEVDLSADRYQADHADDYSMRFHLHEGDDYWYNDHPESGERITFAEGIEALPHFAYEEADGEHLVTIDGETYDGRDSATELAFFIDGETYDGRDSATELAFFVDGDPVDPTDHEVQDGDALRLEIETEA